MDGPDCPIDVYENIMKVRNFKLCSCIYLASTVCFISTHPIFKVKTEKPKTEKIRGIQGLKPAVLFAFFEKSECT